MRILLAEDELLERKAMKKFISENFPDIRVIDEAVNGRKAIESACMHKPDIIFMDIKMPGINGLEAMEEILQQEPQIKFVLLTAFDSFDYAKHAMQFGVKDYLLKPGNKEEIIRTVQRLKKEIELENKHREEAHVSTELMKEQFITKIMHKSSDKELESLQLKLFPQMERAYFLVGMSNKVYDPSEIKAKLETLLHDRFVVTVNDDAFIICVLPSAEPDKAVLLSHARKLVLALAKDTYIGIGDSAASIKRLRESFQDAYAACFKLKNEHNANYGFLQNTKKTSDQTKIITAICAEVEAGNAEQAIILFKECQDNLTMQDKEEIYLKIKQQLQTFQLNYESSITALITNFDWYHFLQVSSMEIDDYNQSKQLISQVKSYIGEHYQEAISLDDIAASVNLSPNYFSNLFKKETGESFIDFLTKYRMGLAKELIQTHLYSLKEISFMVGYKDPNYFSRVFKKYYFESPKSYQRKIFKK